MRNIVLLLILLLARPGLAQTAQTIDSLKQSLARLNKQPLPPALKDSLTYQAMAALIKAYANVQIDSAQVYNEQLTKRCEQKKDGPGLLKRYIYTAYLFRLQNKNYEAIGWLYKALSLAEKQNDHAQIGYIYYMFGYAYLMLNNAPKAMFFCDKTMQYLKKYPDIYTEIETLNILGAMAVEKRDYSKALSYYIRFNKLAEINGSDWFKSQSLNEIGRVYEKLNQPDKALLYYNKALVLARKTERIDLEGYVLEHLADLWIMQRNWPKAIQVNQYIRQKGYAAKNNQLLLAADDQLYRLYEKMGDYKQSLSIYKRYVTLRDTLNVETNQTRLMGLQAQYESSQKDNFLKQQQLKLATQQADNQQLAQTKNWLFFGVFVVLIAAGLLVWNNRRLTAKNTQINEQSRLLTNAQTELATLNQSLAAKVADRTRELVDANAELIRKNEEIRGALFRGQTIERKRVAVELHDNLSSLLSAINFSIQGIDPAGLSAQEQLVYRNIRHMITNAYAEVRNISHNILPAELEQAGLVNALTGMLDKLNQNSPIRFQLQTDLPPHRLPPEIEFNLYSIGLELINNVIRHAGATETCIRLSRTSEAVCLSVTDNGRGFAPGPKHGVGLQNIQSRLDALGGTCQITAHVLTGTAVNIKIPVVA